MKSLKFYKILSLVLVILNIATLAFFYFNRPPAPLKPGKAQLADEIGLTREAKKKVDALEIEHHKNKQQLMRENFKLQMQLYQHLSDSAKANELLEKVDVNSAETDRMTYTFFSEVAALCNDSQRKKLDAIINKGLRRITNQPPGKRQ